MQGKGQIRTLQQMKLGGPGGGASIVMPQRQTLNMLAPQGPPQTIFQGMPSPGIMPGNTNLISFPFKIQSSPLSHQNMSCPTSTATTTIVSSNSIILPPNTTHRQLFPSQTDSDDGDDPLPSSIFRGGSFIIPGQGELINSNVHPALVDHNYYCPPPKSPVPVLQAEPDELRLQTPYANVFNYEENIQSYGAGSFATKLEPAGLAEVVNDPPGSNTIAGEPIGTCVLPSHVQANLNSIEEAGVGPMAPLMEDDTSRMSASSNEDRGGEETETAPEAEGEDDSVTRCICDFLHDDGYMICCDKCLVWQHVVCMGLDKNNIPEEYLCEVCKPRPIDRKKARMLQTKRREELFKNTTDSSDDERQRNARRFRQDLPQGSSIKKRSSSGTSSSCGKKVVEKKIDFKPTVLPNRKNKLAKKTVVLEKPLPAGPDHPFDSPSQDKETKVKKTYRKRKTLDKISSLAENRQNSKKMPRRKSQSVMNTDSDAESQNGAAEEIAEIDQTQQSLRSWIDQYEEAITNHYSPELRARLSGNKFAGLGNELRSTTLGCPTRCNISLKGNGVKILTASCNLSSNMPVIECKGKLMLSSQYRATARSKSSSPYVLFYQLGDYLEIALDEKTYGNDSRFCRRSVNHNAELRHVLDKGSLHLFIVAVKAIEKNQEILLPLENSSNSSVPLPSINADVREIKKPVNGLLNTSTDDEPLAARDVKERKKKERKKSKRNLSVTSTTQENVSEEAADNQPRKTRAQVKPKVEPTPKKEFIKEEPTELATPVKVEPEFHFEEKSVHTEEEKDLQPLNSPIKMQTKSSPTSSTMLGLPDGKGLIVGVNTINYDASSSVRNKAKSREERKMEMIMKAFEAMERAEQRRKETITGGGDLREDKNCSIVSKKRRQSSSSLKIANNDDSNVDASSADESKAETKSLKRKSRRSGPSTPQRRRSRVLSGGTVSALSTDEDHVVTSAGLDSCISNTGPFRFPKTKKSLMTDWLQESSDSLPHIQNDDDVSANYLRGNRSPPGIATHLLRSTAPLSPNKSVCSAKKRWLRQAISEDHTEDQPANGSGSPSDACFGDYVAPLKKRRLASYKDDQDNSKLPNGLKKKFFSNLVLEAVLDRAHEDMCGTNRSSAVSTFIPSSPDDPQMKDHSSSQSPLKDLDEASSSQDAFSADNRGPKEEEDEDAYSHDEEDFNKDNEMESVVPEPQDEACKTFSSDVEDRCSQSFIKNEEIKNEIDEDDEIKEEEIKEEEEDIKDENELKDEDEIKEEESTEDEEATFADTESKIERMDVESSDPDRTDEDITDTNNIDVPVSAETPCDNSEISDFDVNEEFNSEVVPAKDIPGKEFSTPDPVPSILIKTPEPSSVFKSYFTPTVSIEELEAEIEATKKARQEDQKFSKLLPFSPQGYESFHGNESQSETSPRPNSTTLDDMCSEMERCSDTSLPTSQSAQSSDQNSQPKEKKRVSLADYKKRRQLSGLNFQSDLNCSRPMNEKDGPGTPTLDEELASRAIPLTLNTLPLFDNLQKMEHSEKDGRIKGFESYDGSQEGLLSPSEPRREDLTERLKKEFGLSMEDDDEECQDGDETPETESPPPPPPPGPPPPSRFTPTQYPSYPPNYPIPPFQSATKYASTTPSVPGPSMSIPFNDTSSYPPPLPPPPPAPIIANAPHPPPPPIISTNRIDSDSKSHSRSNGIGLYSARKPSLSVPSGKDYFLQNNSGGRSYYSNPMGGNQVGNRRDYRPHRDRDRDYQSSRSSSGSTSSTRRNGFPNSGRTYY